MSFNSTMRPSPEARITPTYSFCRSVSSVNSSSWAAPRMPFIGVRSSCEMTPRKLDLAALAASALSRAACSSAISEAWRAFTAVSSSSFIWVTTTLISSDRPMTGTIAASTQKA